jgi:hypothetical protein
VVTFWPIFVNERAKRPPSITFKGTNCKTFFLCQGDDCNDEVCEFQGFKETKVLLPKLLAIINKLLEGVDKENEDILPQKIELEKVQFELQALAQTSKGGMLDRKKSIHGTNNEFELLVEKAKKLRK